MPSLRRDTTGLSLLVQLSLVVSCASPVRALDKQGSAHGGDPGGAESGFALSGNLLLGAALFNPSYGARPDNSGRAFGRLATHLDVDLIGARLSIPVDVNVFTDRDRNGLEKLIPSELDVISGVTSTWPLGPTALELGVRLEMDRPVDRGDYSQTYVDARARWLFSLGAFWPSVADALAGGDISGTATLGWFAYNPTYPARPDNSGIALLRYAAHVSLSYTEYFFVALDTSFFTDRNRNPFAPTECDVTLEVGVQFIASLALHLAYERDMPIDRAGYVPHFLLLYLTWDFDLVSSPAT